MKTLLSFLLLLITISTSFAQQRQTFDIASFIPPESWQNETKDFASSYVTTNNLTGGWCRATVYKSIGSSGNSVTDFNNEWGSLIMKSYPEAAVPTPEATTEDGWTSQAGVAKVQFNNQDAAYMLTTVTGYGVTVSILVSMNSDEFMPAIESFLESVDLKKPETLPAIQADAPQTTTNEIDGKNSILGTWGATASDNSSWRMNNGVMNYIQRQYTFSTDGTYNFTSKAFDPLMDKILLGKENGTYQITGNSITVMPQKSVLEGWSKKDGADKWGNLLNIQNIALEKTTYQLTQHYFSGIQEWNLVLQSGKATVRDGPHSTNSTFANAWYYRRPSSNNQIIELPAGQQHVAQKKNEELVKQPVVAVKVNGKFAFNTTNFDNGWSATEQEDWVQVSKRNIKVLVHYPNKDADTYNSVLMDGLKNAWNILVAPRYSSAFNMEFKPVTGWQSIEFAEADMVEKATGQTVHVVLFKINYSGGDGNYMEFIAPDKKTFEQEFGAYHQESYGWEKMEVMAGYNKFAVAVTDLTGKWTNQFSGLTQYVNANTGASAGADTHASAQNFEFLSGNKYKWDLAVASGFVGNIKFQNVKSNGTFTMPNNWQIEFSDLEGKPKTYNAYFSCIKGGARILWLQDTGYGGYSGYGKAP